jgi:hypothetical protein
MFIYDGKTGQHSEILPISFPKEPINLYLNPNGDDPRFYDYRFWFWDHTNGEPVDSIGYNFCADQTGKRAICTLSVIGY